MKQPDIRSYKRFMRPAIFGVVAGVITCTVLLVLVSCLMLLNDFPYEMLVLLTTIIFVIGGFTAGYISAKKTRERGMVMGLMCGIILSLLLCIGNIAVHGASFGMTGLTKFVCVMIAAALGGVLGVNKRRKTKI